MPVAYFRSVPYNSTPAGEEGQKWNAIVNGAVSAKPEGTGFIGEVF